MFHLQRESPTTAGGKKRATKVQLLKSTRQLGVHNIITSWYLQFTESYKVYCFFKKKIHPTCAYSHADTEFMQMIKKKSYPFYPSEMLHLVHPQINRGPLRSHRGLMCRLTQAKCNCFLHNEK